MPGEADQVVVEFVADTTQLTPAVDQLAALGDIDSGTAVAFTKTNQALADRNALISAAVKNTDQLSASVSAQQAIYNKLVAFRQIPYRGPVNRQSNLYSNYPPVRSQTVLNRLAFQWMNIFRHCRAPIRAQPA